MQKIKSILKDESGQGMLEYIVAIGGIVLIVSAIMIALRSGLVGSASGGEAATGSAVDTLITKVKSGVNSVGN